MAGASGAGQGWGPASPAAPALKVSPLFFRLGRRHPGRRPGLRGGEEPRGVQRLRHPLLPQLPGEPRPAPPRGAPSSDPPPPPPTPGPGTEPAHSASAFSFGARCLTGGGASVCSGRLLRPTLSAVVRVPVGGRRAAPREPKQGRRPAPHASQASVRRAPGPAAGFVSASSTRGGG